MDSRQARRLKKRIRKAEDKINKVIILRVSELSKDKELTKKIQGELKDLKTREEINEYIRTCHGLAKSDIQTRQMAE